MMESLSKEKNLILGLLLGMVIVVAIPYAPSSEARASSEVTSQLFRGNSEEVDMSSYISCQHVVGLHG